MKNYTVEHKEGFTRYINQNGPVIGAADAPVIEADGFIFKDLERTGELLPYEDWRLDDESRAKDLAARWNNEMQRFVETLPHGIPINFSSDPRHGAGSASAEYKSQAGQVSRWPEGLAMAATFSPELCRQYAEIVAKEYRALGITTALSPQIDLGTEPRWMRVEDTFGPDPELVTRMGKAYCDGLQTTKGSPDGWGMDSVCAMVKHWPGGGPCEAGCPLSIRKICRLSGRLSGNASEAFYRRSVSSGRAYGSGSSCHAILHGFLEYGSERRRECGEFLQSLSDS